MNCPRCDSPAETQALEQFGGVCPKCLLEFAAEKDAPSFPNLEIVSTLGEGGMGVVYKAVQKPLGRTVALKVLSPQLAGDPAFVERFTREAKALAQLSHPNIVSIHDFGVHDGVPYLIMEYVDGTPLRKLLAAKKLTSEQALDVVPQICDALQYAHARGVVHRDVKPENILLDRGGRVKIADFGLAKLAEVEQTRITRTNMLMGTPHYMAPEQIENPSAVDHRADIYSLGVIFYEMLTGELPLGRFKPPSARAPVDCRLDPVVLKSLEKEPIDRYQSAGEVKDHITHLDGAPGAILGRGGDKKRSSSPGALWLASAILALVAIALALQGGPRSSVIWIGFASAVCGVVALVRMGIGVPPVPQGSATPESLSRVRVHHHPPKKNAVLGGALGGVGLLLLVALLVTRSAGESSAPPRAPHVAGGYPLRPPIQLRLSELWPSPEELPEGFQADRQLKGGEALRAAGLPVEWLADTHEVRYLRVTPGEVEFVGLEFKTPLLAEIGWNAPELQLGGRWVKRSGGTNFYMMSHGTFAAVGETVDRLWEAIAKKEREANAQPRNK